MNVIKTIDTSASTTYIYDNGVINKVSNRSEIWRNNNKKIYLRTSNIHDIMEFSIDSDAIYHGPYNGELYDKYYRMIIE